MHNVEFCDKKKILIETFHRSLEENCNSRKVNQAIEQNPTDSLKS